MRRHFTLSINTCACACKDWPCADDLLAFTAHLRDLDERLPLPEYTRTAGSLHLVSHIPEYFVRPELSVLRLHAGQSSTVCGQVAALTRLRVDVVDHVSAAVYVAEKEEHDKHGSPHCLNLVQLPSHTKLECAPMPNVMVALPSVQHRKVWLTPTTRCHAVTVPRRETR